MWIGDQIYLGLVIGAFTTFIVGLAYVSWYTGRKPPAPHEAKDSAEIVRPALKKVA